MMRAGGTTLADLLFSSPFFLFSFLLFKSYFFGLVGSTGKTD
jgi:hypothetical protein